MLSIADTAVADTAGAADTDLTDALGADAINDADTAGAADTAGDPDTDLADALGADAINVNAVDSGTIDAVILKQGPLILKLESLSKNRPQRRFRPSRAEGRACRAKATKSVKVNPVDFNDLEMSLVLSIVKHFLRTLTKGSYLLNPLNYSKNCRR